SGFQRCPKRCDDQQAPMGSPPQRPNFPAPRASPTLYMTVPIHATPTRRLGRLTNQKPSTSDQCTPKTPSRSAVMRNLWAKFGTARTLCGTNTAVNVYSPPANVQPY